MKNKLNKRLMSWMTSGTLLTNPNYDSNSLCKVFVYPLFLLLIALGVCGCKSGNEPSQSTPILSVSSPAPAAGADSLQSVLEGVSQWRVMAINKVVSSFTINLSTEGTTVCFANSEVTFAVPYTSINFNDNSEPTTEYEQHGPYSVSYLSSNTLSIADEQFKVSTMADGGYALIAEDLTIVIEK